MIRLSKPIIGKEEKKAVAEVLESGMLVQGKKVEQLENEFSRIIGTRHAVATSNGTTALYLALLAAGIGEGDEVITTPFSFIATTNAILFAKAKPVFVDIDMATFNIDADKIEEKITKKTKAILPVHLYGLPCNMEKIMKIAKKNNLLVIEDACQAHGAEFFGRKAGSFGIGCFSLYATKNIMAGEGGILTTDSDKIDENARMLRNHGSKKRYYHELIGFNFRLTDINAAIGLAQLNKLEEFTSKRIENAEVLSSLINHKGIVTPIVPKGHKHVFHQYTIRVTTEYPLTRDELISHLNKNGIDSAVFYPLPIYKQQAYKGMFDNVKLKNVEQVCEEVISLPVHPMLQKAELKQIADAINNPKK